MKVHGYIATSSVPANVHIDARERVPGITLLICTSKIAIFSKPCSQDVTDFVGCKFIVAIVVLFNLFNMVE
jgi:hypothetical protein